MIMGCVNEKKCHECSSETGKKSFTEVNLALDCIRDSLNPNYNHVEFPQNLYEYPQFNDMVNDICASEGQLVKIILNDTSTIKKEISLLVLHHLCINSYLPLLERLYSGYKRGKLEKKYFIYSMYTRLSNAVVKDYENRNLKNFIDLLLMDSDVATFVWRQK